MSGEHEPISIDALIKEYARQEWGFTGTRKGMSVAQHGWARRLLNKGHPTTLRHGGAYGADTQVHAIWRELRLMGTVDVWPADEKRRSMFLNQPRVNVRDSMDPLARNEQIVAKSTFLFGAPHTQHEVIRSGTWHTLRHGIRNAVPTLILWPNGQMTLHRDKVLFRVV